jgi:hypothetical protein
MIFRIVFALLLLLALLSMQQCKPVDLGTAAPTPIDTTKSHIDTTNYTCAGKISCSAMVSCAEAQYYLQHCPFTNMD